MSRVEQRMEIAPLQNPVENANQEYEVVKEQENPQLAIWLERLALPELCQEERLEIVDQLKHALSLTLNRQNAPPVMVIATL